MYIFLASNAEWKIYRKLYSFESAYVSLKRIIGSVDELSNQLRLVLIRNYWNPLIDEELLKVSVYAAYYIDYIIYSIQYM